MVNILTDLQTFPQAIQLEKWGLLKSLLEIPATTVLRRWALNPEVKPALAEQLLNRAAHIPSELGQPQQSGAGLCLRQQKRA